MKDGDIFHWSYKKPKDFMPYHWTRQLKEGSDMQGYSIRLPLGCPNQGDPLAGLRRGCRSTRRLGGLAMPGGSTNWVIG